MHCCITGLTVMHRPVLTGLVVHPEFYTTTYKIAHDYIARAFSTESVDAVKLRLAIAVCLRHWQMLHPMCASDPYIPMLSTDERYEVWMVDLLEEAAAAYQLNAWAAERASVSIACITEHTCRSVMAGIGNNVMEYAITAIKTLPPSLAEQLYSLVEPLNQYSIDLTSWGYDHSQTGTLCLLSLYAFACEAPIDREPMETYELLQSRLKSIVGRNSALMDSIYDGVLNALKPSGKRLMKALMAYVEKPQPTKVVVPPVTNVLANRVALSNRLKQLRGQVNER